MNWKHFLERFDKAFKEQVVLRILAKETTISKMAEELGGTLHIGQGLQEGWRNGLIEI